jgi:hypothetical protein
MEGVWGRRRVDPIYVGLSLICVWLVGVPHFLPKK